MTPRTRRRDRRALWVACLLPWILPLAAMCSAPRADAVVLRTLITTTVVWTGDARCITIWLPVGGDQAEPVNACSNQKMWTASYLAPQVGEWIGVDPDISGAETLSCMVSTSDGGLVTDFAVRGDGHNVTCLVRWAG
jgi:hypothetical protein